MKTIDQLGSFCRRIAGVLKRGTREPTPRQMIDRAVEDAYGFPLPDWTVKEVAASIASGAKLH